MFSDEKVKVHEALAVRFSQRYTIIKALQTSKVTQQLVGDMASLRINHSWQRASIRSICLSRKDGGIASQAALTTSHS
jgi:hypothetical protein